MLNTRFPTVESLGSLDARIAEINKLNEQVDREQEDGALAAAAARESRNAALKKLLPQAFESQVAAAAEIARLPAHERPQAEKARAQVQRLLKVRAFGNAIREIDALVAELQKEENLRQKGALYQRLLGLEGELESKEFQSACKTLKQETEAAIAPARAEAAAALRAQLGDWPKSNPASQEFREALCSALLFDGPDLDQASGAFGVLAEQLELRLRFNFESQQKTRQFDKPEWLYYFFGKLLAPHLQWLKEVIQPVVEKAHPEQLAINAFISALLPSVQRAAKLYLQNSRQSHEMLSHFLEESQKFDRELVQEYYYFLPNWPGLTTTILLEDQQAYELWKQYEEDAANLAFSELNANPKAWEIDYDSTDASITSRPTLIALGLSALFDSLTDLYRPLQLPRFQLEFLNEIQLPLVERYVFLIKHQKNHPQADLDDYGKVLGSLGYLVDFLSCRSAQPIFIDLAAGTAAGTAAGAAAGTAAGELVPAPSIFYPTIQSLVALRDSCLSETTDMLAKALPQLFRAHVHKRDYSPEEASQSLYKPVEKLSARLGYFKNICNVVDYETIKMDLSESLGNYLFKTVVQAASFTPAQGKSLHIDLDFIWNGLDFHKDHQYEKLVGAAEYFESGTRPSGWADEAFSLIQHRRR